MITIVVLLILAGVTITTLTGDNGILTQASKAKDTTAEAEAIERVKVEVAGSYGTDGKIDSEQLKKNLGNISGLTYNSENFSLPATVSLNGYDIIIDANGNVTKKVAVAEDKVLTTITGYPMTLTNSTGDDLVNYNIYGNSVQNGTATPEIPFEVENVGDLVTDKNDENYGKYKIPVKVNDTITNIYLDEPLRKVGDCADYIDFENKKVVRKTAYKFFDGTEDWKIYNGNTSDGGKLFYLDDSVNKQPYYKELLSNYFTKSEDSGTIGTWMPYKCRFQYYQTGIFASSKRLYISTKHTSVSEFKSWLNNLEIPVYIIFSIIEPTEETVELPDILTAKGTNIITVDTTIEPSNMEVEYWR